MERIKEDQPAEAERGAIAQHAKQRVPWGMQSAQCTCRAEAFKINLHDHFVIATTYIKPLRTAPHFDLRSISVRAEPMSTGHRAPFASLQVFAFPHRAVHAAPCLYLLFCAPLRSALNGHPPDVQRPGKCAGFFSVIQHGIILPERSDPADVRR